MNINLKTIDKKYNTCITSSIHTFISEVFSNTKWKELFDRLGNEMVLREFSKTMANEYIKTHKSYRVIRNEKASTYEPIIFDLTYSKLFKIKYGGIN